MKFLIAPMRGCASGARTGHRSRMSGPFAGDGHGESPGGVAGSSSVLFKFFQLPIKIFQRRPLVNVVHIEVANYPLLVDHE
jgi:hypothetical protein